MKLIITLGALLPLFACAGEAPTTTTDMTTTAAPLGHIERSVHTVQCGCKIESIGHCGNYVLLEGQAIPISTTGKGGELGAMEWCSVESAKAEVEGDVQDGEFVATYIKKIEP